VNMELSIRTRSIEMTDELRDLTFRRVRFAVDAFADRFVSGSVYLGDVNGPRGGATDKVCHIAVVIRGLGEIVVRASGPTAPAALGRATQSLKYRVSEALKTRQHRECESIRTSPPAA
jgi:hypothetical protein